MYVRKQRAAALGVAAMLLLDGMFCADLSAASSKTALPSDKLGHRHECCQCIEIERHS